VPAEIRSIMNVQEATAKALLVDADALSRAQREGDVLGANEVLMDAFSTDVRPLLREVRQDMGLDPDPLAAYARSDHAGQLVAARGTTYAAGWGQ
jgi:L-rhamnose isomerase/sugar isomerase